MPERLANVRRVAGANGYRVLESRRREAEARGYMLVDKETSMIVLGGPAGAYSATLDDVEAWLRRESRPQH